MVRGSSAFSLEFSDSPGSGDQQHLRADSPAPQVSLLESGTCELKSLKLPPGAGRAMYPKLNVLSVLLLKCDSRMCCVFLSSVVRTSEALTWASGPCLRC